uniref:Uncharacterized protein n=1 Tax=Moniliophthora roreri TaxID=221103 RepID=A0A0W0GEW3_MONRR
MPSSYLHMFLPNLITASTDPKSCTTGLFLGYSISTNPLVSFSNPVLTSLTRSKFTHQSLVPRVFHIDQSIGNVFEPGANLPDSLPRCLPRTSTHFYPTRIPLPQIQIQSPEPCP